MKFSALINRIAEVKVALFTRAWIEIRKLFDNTFIIQWSPSLRGRGLKCVNMQGYCNMDWVALFTRAWIEIVTMVSSPDPPMVALFTRAWIEISRTVSISKDKAGRPLYEGVD